MTSKINGVISGRLERLGSEYEAMVNSRHLNKVIRDVIRKERNNTDNDVAYWNLCVDRINELHDSDRVLSQGIAENRAQVTLLMNEIK